jgi:hypothetical protein
LYQEAPDVGGVRAPAFDPLAQYLKDVFQAIGPGLAPAT